MSDLHAEACIRWIPADGRGSEAREVRGLLNPGVCFLGGIDAKPAPRVPGDAFLANVPGGLRSTRGEEADDVSHVASTDEESAAIDRVTDQLGDPSHGLRLDFSGSGRQHPRTNVCIDSRGEKVSEDADWGRWRRDVTEEARVSVEEPTVEQELRCRFEQRAGLGACSGSDPLRSSASRNS